MHLVQFILSAIPALIQQYAEQYRETDLEVTLKELKNDLSLPRIQTYDYIVGGGTAGCVVASRLSETKNVLLLESGGNPVPAMYAPYIYHYGENAPEITNTFHSAPQKFFSLGTAGVYNTVSGRMMGGSGSLNDDVYNRGSPYGYDYIAEITQDNSWCYRNVLKFFKKIENYVGRLIHEEEREAYYGTGGPVNVDTSINPPRLLIHWLQAGQQLGFRVTDPNAHQSPSFTPVAHSTRGGEKGSSYVSYIKPIQGIRRTLTILRYSKVEKVLIDSSKKAYGVLYHRHGIPQIAHATHEVILSAGAISSPILLVKSGLGPKALLEKAKIPLELDIPGIGKNLRDHCGVTLYFNVDHEKLAQIDLPTLLDANVEKELTKFQVVGNRTGIFSSHFAMALAFTASSRAISDGEGDWPDLQFHITQTHFPFGDRSLQGQDFRISIVLGRPKSLGELRFNVTAFRQGVTNDTELAILDHKYFTEESDIWVMVEGIKLALRVAEETESFQEIGTKYVAPIPNSCKLFSFRSDEYWKCFLKYKARPWLHTVGTVSIGSDKDSKTVLDSRFRVRGITGLRVVDASIFPRPPNSNIHAPIMMAAEKAAEDIITSSIANARKLGNGKSY